MCSIPRTLIQSELDSHVYLFGAKPEPHVNLFEVELEHDVHSFVACLNPTYTYSRTVSRAAHPNLHSGRLRPLLQVAARICDLAS